jgi:hypothetical protein
MHYEPLPPNLEQGIERFASEQHISTTEALRKLVETGLMTFKPAPQKSQANAPSEVVTEALRKAELVRAARTEELAALSTRNESAALLIGFLKDEPEVVEAIRQAAHDHRQALYT